MKNKLNEKKKKETIVSYNNSYIFIYLFILFFKINLRDLVVNDC